MSYRYAVAPGYLSPYPAMPQAHSPTHEDMNSYKYCGSQDTRSYHSRTNYARSDHSAGTRPAYSCDAQPIIITSGAGSLYSPGAHSVRSTDMRSTHAPDMQPTSSYKERYSRSVDARSTHSATDRSARPIDTKSVHSTGKCSDRSRSKSRTRAGPEPQQFLNVQPAPVHYRSPSAAGSHRSRAAPSLTHSAASALSDDDNESDPGRPVVGLNTPYTAKVSLWRDDVHDLCESVPPEIIIPPHVKARYEHERRQQEASPLLSANDSTNIATPSYTVRSRAPSTRSASPPYSLPTPPSAPASDLESIVDEIERIDYQVNSRILDFTFPTSLEFGEKLPNGDFPPLLYVGRNKPLIEHRHYLDKTLLRIDEIQSFNDSRVKETRRRVVTKIQEQLEQLNRMEKMVRDNMHYERWKKTPRIQITAPPTMT
ncbi:unnamed protein product [Rhizoctonia solani]|uniref:BAG domain-containing protein n=1 Tax=Rhizoctonia solani TaxID=456999 RepID=A0A8H3B1N7_9AGAM|nr:unnamed protein product [Rhizoctonia solani]